VVIFTPRPLYPRGKSPRYPLDRMLGGPQSRSGRLGEKKILDPTGTRTPTPPPSSPQPVAIPTTLPRLLLLLLPINNNNKTPWLLVRKRTIPTERPPLVGEVSANFNDNNNNVIIIINEKQERHNGNSISVSNSSHPEHSDFITFSNRHKLKLSYLGLRVTLSLT
jgi:hypothetical protein